MIKITLKKINSFVVAISPLLAQYYSGLFTFTLLDIVLLVLIFLNLLFLKACVDKTAIFVLAFILISLVQSIIFSESSHQILPRVLRFSVYILFVLLFFKNFDLEVLKKYFIIFCKIVIYYFLYQYLSLLFFNYYPTGAIPGLSLMRTEVLDFESSIYKYKSWIRPRSILGEPSQIGIVLGLYLFLSYYWNKLKLFDFFIISTVIILTKSFTAYAFLLSFIAFFLYIKNSIIFKFIILFSVAFIPFFYSHLTFDDYKFYGSLLNRVGRYDFIFYHLSTFSDFIFGVGYHDGILLLWQPSFNRLLISFGFLGVLLFLIFLLSITNPNEKFSYVFVFIYFIMMFANEVALSYFNILYITTMLIFLSNNTSNFKVKFNEGSLGNT